MHSVVISTHHIMAQAHLADGTCRCVASQTLLQSSSFNYLGLALHESDGLASALKRLAQTAVRACAGLRTELRWQLYNVCMWEVPMMSSRQMCHALVLSTISTASNLPGCGMDVWVRCAPMQCDTNQIITVDDGSVPFVAARSLKP